MNKLAKYLNQHLHGEVFTDEPTLLKFSTDESPLTLKPEMVVAPRETNDIRKLMKFSWQLAKKGHTLPVTTRGAGRDTTGASIGSGVVLAISEHMHNIFEIDTKQRLVRLQPGVSISSLRNALRLQGMDANRLRVTHSDATMGGIVAGARGQRITNMVNKLEVVLANGDMIQTRRVSKRELSKLKGMQSFEADIYRGIDMLIEDNSELVETLDEKCAAGYASLAQVKGKDGSIDLTPLFIGSQGTLGIISEMILKVDYASEKTAAVLGCFPESAAVRDTLEMVYKTEPSKVVWFDRGTLAYAEELGKSFFWLENSTDATVTMVAYIDEASERTRAKKMKRIAKIFEKFGAGVIEATDVDRSPLLGLDSVHLLRDAGDARPISMLEGVFVPLERFDSFINAVGELSNKRKVAITITGEPLRTVWSLTPQLNLGTVSGKQMALKLIKEVAEIVARHGGYLAAGYGEGRLQSFATTLSEDQEVNQLYASIRQIFDPHATLNAGVKSVSDVKDLVRMLRNN